MRPLSHDIQQNVLSLLGQGFTTRQVAEQCGISHSTVQRLRKKCLTDAELSRGGRPEKLSPQDKRACVCAVTSGRLDTATAAAKQLREETGVEVSDLTVRRALREAGLMAQEKEAKPKLSAKNIKARLDFARRHRHWTVEDRMLLFYFGTAKRNGWINFLFWQITLFIGI